MLALAHAHVERFVLESFQAAVQRELALAELCTLFAWSCLQSDSGFFLEHGHGAPADVKALRRSVRSLLAQVAVRALDYSAAFGIPEHCLGPLADPGYLERSGLITAR